MARKSRSSTPAVRHEDGEHLWHGAGWRLVMTAILLGVISGLILLAGALDFG